MLRELSGAPDLGELIEPGSVFSANQPTVRPNSHRPLQTARRLSPRSPRTARMTEPAPGSTPVLGSATKRPWFPIEGMAMVLPQRIQRSAGQTRLDAIFLPACSSSTGRSIRAPSRIGIQPNPALPTSVVNLVCDPAEHLGCCPETCPEKRGQRDSGSGDAERGAALAAPQTGTIKAGSWVTVSVGNASVPPRCC